MRQVKIYTPARTLRTLELLNDGALALWSERHNQYLIYFDSQEHAERKGYKILSCFLSPRVHVHGKDT